MDRLARDKHSVKKDHNLWHPVISIVVDTNLGKQLSKSVACIINKIVRKLRIFVIS